MRKTLNAKVISGLGLMIALTACGDNPSASVPPGLPDAPAPKNVIEPENALTVTGPDVSTGAPTTLPPSLDIATLKGTAWSSNCYRFSDKGDYSKKFWSFGDGTMHSLLLKYKDEACTQVSTPKSAYGVWDISSITVGTLRGDWSVVRATCTSGNCSTQIDVAFRVKDKELHEGTKDSKSGNYYIDEGKYVAYTKAKVDLNKLAADANKAAPVGNAPSTNTGNGTTTTPTTPVSTADATGLGDLSSLSAKVYGVCIPGKADRTGVIKTSSKRTLSFAQGDELAADSYTSTNASYTTADCTGTAKDSAPWTFTNLLVKASDVEGWILLDARACSGSGCKPQKALIQITADGFKQAGEDSKNPGKYFTDTARDYVLIP